MTNISTIFLFACLYLNASGYLTSDQKHKNSIQNRLPSGQRNIASHHHRRIPIQTNSQKNILKALSKPFKAKLILDSRVQPVLQAQIGEDLLQLPVEIQRSTNDTVREVDQISSKETTEQTTTTTTQQPSIITTDAFVEDDQLRDGFVESESISGLPFKEFVKQNEDIDEIVNLLNSENLANNHSMINNEDSSKSNIHINIHQDLQPIADLILKLLDSKNNLNEIHHERVPPHYAASTNPGYDDFDFAIPDIQRLLVAEQMMNEHPNAEVSSVVVESQQPDEIKTQSTFVEEQSQKQIDYLADRSASCHAFIHQPTGSRFMCPHGLKFNDDIQACDWPQNVVC